MVCRSALIICRSDTAGDAARLQAAGDAAEGCPQVVGNLESVGASQTGREWSQTPHKGGRAERGRGRAWPM